MLFCLSAGNAKSRVLADPGFFFFFPSARLLIELCIWFEKTKCWNNFEAVAYNLGDLMYLSRLKLLTFFNSIRFYT